MWRGGRAVECTGLENRRWSNPTVGSNPTLSATSPRQAQRGSPSRRQGHDEATAAILHHFAASIAPMAARDLPYQCQTQPGSAAVGGIFGAIERPEHVFKFRLRYA